MTRTFKNFQMNPLLFWPVVLAYRFSKIWLMVAMSTAAKAIA